MKASLVSVAQEAGVSIMTVSRVIHNHPKVSKETRSRVLAILKKQDYRRSPFHAAWHVSRHGDRVATQPSIVFLCGAPKGGSEQNALKAQPWMAAIWQGVRERAAALGLMVDFYHVPSGNPGWRRITTILEARGVNGVVVGPLPEQFASIELPIDHLALAAADCGQALGGIHRATQNHYDGMRRIFARLLAAGYERPGMVASIDADARACQWMGAFLERQSWLPVKNQVPPLRFVADGTEREFRQWCEASRPDVVVTAMGGIARWCENMRRGRSKPPDLFLLDLDGPLSFAAKRNGVGSRVSGSTRYSELTGLRYPGVHIGTAAVELVAAQLRHYEHGLPKLPKTLRIDSIFQVGKSCRLGVE